VQGDTKLRCKVLVVHYDNNQPRAMKAATPGAGGSQQISRLEAKGGVVVTQQEQTATGDSGLFDMKANTITLLGNVTVSQGGNVVRGERLVVDMTTGVSTVDAGNSRGPVRMLIEQNKDGSSINKSSKPPLVR
jgi:lipopolysaccharide export system protein LptA